jgi:hypothetical protein
MADLSFLLSPQDRAKLGRQVGIMLPDGRRFQRGVLTSAQDAAQTNATSAMNAGYSAQTGEFANRSPAIDPRQMGKDAYNAQMSQHWQANGYGAAPQQVGGPMQPQNPVAQLGQMPAMPQPSPYEDMLNRARLTQQTYQAGGGVQQAPAIAPIATPAPLNPNATAQIGDRTFGGPTGEAFPAAQGVGFPGAPATADQKAAFTAQTQAAPAPDLLRPRSTAEIAAMTPAQRAGLVQFGQEQAQQSYQTRLQDATIAKVQSDAQPQPRNTPLGVQAAEANIAAQEQSLGRALTAAERADAINQALRSGSQAGDPEASARIKLLSDDLAKTPDAADAARSLIGNIANLERKLDEGLKTGRLESLKTDAMGVANALGIPIDEAALGNRETAQAIFGQFLLEFFAKTKGAITERENALFASLGPQFNKSPAANKELIGLVKERLQLDLDVGKVYRDGLAKGDSLATIAAKQQELRAKYEVKYDDRLNKLETQFGASPAATQSAATPASQAPAAAPASTIAPNIEALLQKYR